MSEGWRVALLGLGSNEGDRDAHLRRALELLRARPDVRVDAVSRCRTTAPVGGPPQDDFRNAAALVSTTLSPRELLNATQAIERAIGRAPERVRWGPRPIDIDILLYADETVAAADLTIPHPRFAERRFALEPAADVAPAMVHAGLGRTVRDLLEALA